MASRSLLRLLLGTVAGCATAHFSAWPVEPKNPASWTFDIGMADARTLILAAFCLEEEQPWTVWSEPAEGDDIRLRAYWAWDVTAPRYLSPVYHTARGPCPVIVGFRLHLSAPSPERTTVRVIAEGTRVVAGKTSGFLRVHGPARIVKPAAPTTVEEYAILRRCGEVFGIHAMPETSVPGEGVEAIASRLVEDRWRATETLIFLGGPRVAACLAAQLDRDGEGAAEAAHVLGRLRATAVLPAVERACRSPRWEVREAAAAARRAIRGQEPSVDDLVAQLRSRAAIDRLDAAIALLSTGRAVERARPVLEPFLGSEISSERWRAAAALVRLRRLSAAR